MNNNDPIETLAKALSEMNLVYDDTTLDMFRKYMDLVLEWNQKVNLTAITDRNEFVLKHFIDSVSCAGDIRCIGAHRIADIGTGAGFPGLPLAIIYRDKEFVLADSLNKRIRILDEIIDSIGLKNVATVHARAEEMARDRKYREKFDLCVSRAVSKLRVLSEYCIPFVSVNGWFAAYKGPESDQEIKDAIPAIRKLGAELIETSEMNMPEYGLFHRIVFIQKKKKTPQIYPRKPGMPERLPL